MTDFTDQLGLPLDQSQERCVFSLSLSEGGRHLVVLSRGYLDLAYLVWLQHRFELLRDGEAFCRILDGKIDLNEVWPFLVQHLLCVTCGPGQ